MMLVLVAEPSCHRCGGPTVEVGPFVQQPLFLHGGYGEATSRTLRVCDWCGRLHTENIESERPHLR